MEMTGKGDQWFRHVTVMPREGVRPRVLQLFFDIEFSEPDFDNVALCRTDVK